MLKSPTLKWSEVQPILECAPCDTLILLDCCFMESAGLDKATQTTELLAACGMETESGGVNNHSFTRSLIDQLQYFGSKPFAVIQLYELLRLSGKRPRNTPRYVPLTGRSRPSTRIAPLQPVFVSSFPALGLRGCSRGPRLWYLSQSL